MTAAGGLGVNLSRESEVSFALSIGHVSDSVQSGDPGLPELSGKDLFDLLRQGEPFPAEADPDSWRSDDRGEPADL